MGKIFCWIVSILLFCSSVLATDYHFSDDAETGTPAENGWKMADSAPIFEYSTDVAYGGKRSLKLYDDGTGDYYQDIPFEYMDSGTFEAWMYDDPSEPIRSYNVIAVAGPTGIQSKVGIYFENFKDFYATQDENPISIESANIPRTKGWHHFALNWDSNINKIKYYVDGTLVRESEYRKDESNKARLIVLGATAYYDNLKLYKGSFIKAIDNDFIIKLINSTEEGLKELEKEDINITSIKSILEEAISSLNEKDYNESYELLNEAQNKISEIKSAINQIKEAELEIDSAKLINVDTREAETKLEEAKKALNEESYTIAKSWADEAKKLVINATVGYVKISDLNALANKYAKKRVKIVGIIKEIEAVYSEGYLLVVDDGTGFIGVAYRGGIGKIREMSRVVINGQFSKEEGAVIAESIKLKFNITNFLIPVAVLAVLLVIWVVINRIAKNKAIKRKK